MVNSSENNGVLTNSSTTSDNSGEKPGIRNQYPRFTTQSPTRDSTSQVPTTKASYNYRKSNFSTISIYFISIIFFILNATVANASSSNILADTITPVTLAADTCSCTEAPRTTSQIVVGAIMIPVLVLLSGVFAGLTIGYMSLDMTQLQILAKTGT